MLYSSGFDFVRPIGMNSPLKLIMNLPEDHEKISDLLCIYCFFSLATSTSVRRNHAGRPSSTCSSSGGSHRMLGSFVSPPRKET